MFGSSDAFARIVADNDSRNGSFVARILRASEHPERQPDADGLYRDEYAEGGYAERRRAERVAA
jgi:hypothetical protein